MKVSELKGSLNDCNVGRVYIHKKTGGEYFYLGQVFNKTINTIMVLYSSRKTGEMFVRVFSDFVNNFDQFKSHKKTSIAGNE